MWLLFSCTQSPQEQDSAQEEPIEAFAATEEQRYIEVYENITFHIGESTGVEFLWDFGDGSQEEGEEVVHSYEQAGIYPVVLTAIGSDGSKKTSTRKVTAHNPLLSPLPQSSSTITLHDGNIWALFREAGTLHRISMETQEQDVFAICPDPRQLIASIDHIAITCLEGLSIWHIPTETSENVPTGTSPYGVVGTVDDWWFTLSGTGELGHYDGETLSTQPMGTDLRTLSKQGDNLYATRWRSGSNGAEVYHILHDERQTHWMNIDYGGDSDNTTGGIPNLLESIIPSPDGSQFMIPMLHANIITGEFLSGTPLKHDNTVRGMMGILDSGLQESPSDRKHFDEKGRSVALAFSPYGDRVYVLHPGVQNLSILNAYTGQFLGSLHQTGVGSNGLAVDEHHIVINSILTREVKVYENKAPYALLWAQSYNATDPLTSQELLGKQIFHDASDTRITKAGYISCAHCHPEADHDGQTWDFTDRGEGLRNTTSLLGRGGTEAGRFHWTGNFDEIQDFEHDIRERFGGSGFLSDEEYALCADPLGTPKSGLSTELDALAAYAQSLIDTPPSPYPTTLQGEERFTALGCVECHPPPLYTDSSLEAPIRHDIGTISASSGNRLGETLDGFDTPSLLGAWNSAPYLHDGSALTIQDAIKAHNGYDTITDEDLNLLFTFVQSLSSR